MLQLRRPEILLLLLAIAVRLIFHLLTGYLADDAFITFRYAVNFGSGNGFVYNVGEHVLGTTTPLFAFILTVLSIARIEPPTGALIVSFLSAGLTTVLIYRMAQSIRFLRLAFVPALCYILWPRSIAADCSGMETAFFTFLIAASFYYQRRHQAVYALGAATLATLTRPEGLILLGLLVAYNLYKEKEKWLQYLAVPSVILLPWIIIAGFYFGSPVPNSLFAKEALYGRIGGMTVWEKASSVVGWNSPLGILLIPILVIGARWLWKKQLFGALELIWLAAMFAFYIFVPARLFFWYVAPIYPVLLLFIGAIFVQAYENALWLGEKRVWAGGVLAVVITIVLVSYDYKPIAYFRTAQRTQDVVHREIGEYLFEHANPDDIVAAEDIGYIGYYSKLRIIDRDGLVSPEVLPYNRIGEYGKLIADFKPEWVVASVGSPISIFIGDDQFLRDYQRETFYVSGETEYRVYRRVDPR
jgi:hypothetical protein